MKDETDGQEVNMLSIFVGNGGAGVIAMLQPLNVRRDVRIAGKPALVDTRTIDKKTRV